MMASITILWVLILASFGQSLGHVTRTLRNTNRIFPNVRACLVQGLSFFIPSVRGASCHHFRARSGDRASKAGSWDRFRR